MDSSTTSPRTALLNHLQAASLQLDRQCNVLTVSNSSGLEAWLAPGASAATTSHSISSLLTVLAPLRATTLLQQVRDFCADDTALTRELGTLTLRPQQAGSEPRQLSVALLRVHPSTDAFLLLHDVTELQESRLAATRAQAAADSALALLRAAPEVVRLFLGSASASIAEIRATLRMPARDQPAVRDKLTRLQLTTGVLAAQARASGIETIAQACEVFDSALSRLQRMQHDISGDELLPLAPLLDHIAGSIGDIWRMEEQRHSAPATPTETKQPGGEQRRPRNSTSWPQATARRWSEFLRRRCEELGTLARLHMIGADLVPASMRRDVDEILQHLLRNAVEHGIETPEQRLAADKPAAGQINVTFEDMGHSGIKLSIRDDGRGFDLQRIGRAAVNCGLASEETLHERDAVDVVGLIFKPAFTTDGLADVAGHGRGMAYLRKAVARFDGQVSVATKAGRYTQFTMLLPVAAAPLDAAVAQ